MKSLPGGKGSGRRQSEVPMAVVDDNWDRIFKKQAEEEPKLDIDQTEQKDTQARS